MNKHELRGERVRLQGLLDKYESGRITHYDEGESGELDRDTTAEQSASLKARFTEIDRKLAEDRRDFHKALRVTPAMEASVTDRLWDIDDIVKLVEANDPKPGKRGPYKKRV